MKPMSTLSTTQLHNLTLLYKFRFTTIPLLTQYKQLKSNSLQRTFNALLKAGYVHRIFEASYKIDRKPAIYFLSNKGIAALKKDTRFKPDVPHTYYKNADVSDSFVQHCVDTLAVFIVLRPTYGDSYQLFTRQEIMSLDDFPETKPDLFIYGDQEYFISLVHDTPSFIAQKRLTEYIAHFEDEGWDLKPYPALLFVLPSSSAVSNFLKHATKALESAGISMDELAIGATDFNTLFAGSSPSANWQYL